MLDRWLDKDHLINLPALFGHFGHEPVKREPTHVLFKRNGRYSVVIHTEKGFLYYHVESPQNKLSASDLVIEEVSRTEGKKSETLWDKVDQRYHQVTAAKELMLDTSKDLGLESVPSDFNHFHSYAVPSKGRSEGVYSDVTGTDAFKDRIFETPSREPLFPLYNIQNETSGYFLDGDKSVMPFGESDAKHSLWYSNIPKTIEWLVVFKDPREAIAFHRKFQLDNAVYMALGEINYETTKILFEIRKLTKVKKIILSFTGSKKIEGYLRDLSFISFIDDTNFMLKLGEGDLKVKFKIGDEKSFLRFYNSIKDFNQGLAKSFLKYNKALDQFRINRHSIVVGKEGEGISVRVPLEVGAIKYFVWSYHKNYLGKTLDILKPKMANWHLEWESDQSITLKGKEVQMEDYRIAL